MLLLAACYTLRTLLQPVCLQCLGVSRVCAAGRGAAAAAASLGGMQALVHRINSTAAHTTDHLPGALLRPWSAAGPPEQELLQCEAHLVHPPRPLFPPLHPPRSTTLLHPPYPLLQQAASLQSITVSAMSQQCF